MLYREPKEENDLFFTCSLIEYIARKTHNTKKCIIEKLGIETVREIYGLADILHCENIEQVIYDYVTKYEICDGEYDYKNTTMYKIPSAFEIGRVYQRLIRDATKEKQQDYIETLFLVFNSWIIDIIDNFNCDMYYQNPSYILAYYREGEVLD